MTGDFGIEKRFRPWFLILRTLKLGVWRKNLNLPSLFRQFPRKMPYPMHICHCHGRIGASYQKQSPFRCRTHIEDGFPNAYQLRKALRVRVDDAKLAEPYQRFGAHSAFSTDRSSFDTYFSQQNVCSAARSAEALACANRSGLPSNSSSRSASDAASPDR